MSAHQKEAIFTELRQYHLNDFPETSNSDSYSVVHKEFLALEESIINMVLSLVNGKSEYVDYGSKLKQFIEMVERQSITDANFKLVSNTFSEKCAHLQKILELAEAGDFPLRKQKVPRISLATKPIITKKNK